MNRRQLESFRWLKYALIAECEQMGYLSQEKIGGLHAWSTEQGFHSRGKIYKLIK